MRIRASELRAVGHKIMRSRLRTTATSAFLIGCAAPAFPCEPIVPFIQVVAPTLALSGSVAALTIAVILKSALFAFFEKRISPIRAGLFMFVGNVLTSFVGVLTAAMIGSGAAFFVGVPIVFVLCWLPDRRLVEAAPRRWLARRSPSGVAALMTAALVASCFLFMIGQVAIRADRLALYWAIKLVAIYLALIASITLTTVWEEWVIWRLMARPVDTTFFGPVLRSNLYILVLVMAFAAALMLPRRLKSPDFLAKRHNAMMAQAHVPPN